MTLHRRRTIFFLFCFTKWICILVWYQEDKMNNSKSLCSCRWILIWKLFNHLLNWFSQDSCTFQIKSLLEIANQTRTYTKNTHPRLVNKSFESVSCLSLENSIKKFAERKFDHIIYINEWLVRTRTESSMNE